MSEEIKSLSVREQCRDKVSVWFGSASNFYHPLKETIANATDEIINNFEKGIITVLLHEDNRTVTVIDTGRGIPIAGTSNGVENYKLLFETLFAGTKYEQTDSTTTGTNGVGNTVINHTSTLFDVFSVHDGVFDHVHYTNGGNLDVKIIGAELEKQKKIFPLNLIEEHGTAFTFSLDDDVYTKTEMEFVDIHEIVKNFSIASNKVTYNVGTVEEDFEVSIFDVVHNESILEYFEEEQVNKTTSDIRYLLDEYNADNEKTKIDLVFSTSTEPIQKTFLNLTYLEEGGSINDGILDGIRMKANKFCRDNKMFPKGVTAFSKQDIEDSVSFVSTVLSNNVEFQNQTKLSTNKKLYKEIAKKHASSMMEIFEAENIAEFKKFINHLLTVQKHNGVNDRAKKKLKKVLTERVDGINNRIENLVDCKEHGDRSELFICEGQSALGSVVLARDASFQAAYPIRGKILNCLKADYETIFKNKIVVDLVKVIGCGIEADKKSKDLETFDISKLRYGKIVAACDADEDGFQISCLIITMIYRLMPKLIEEGHVYIATTPLYEFKTSTDKVYYAFSETEKDEIASKIKERYIVNRNKGLGETDAAVLAETTMNPETRNIIKVNIEDAKAVAESFDAWMGDDIQSRKDFISENINDYKGDID